MSTGVLRLSERLQASARSGLAARLPSAHEPYVFAETPLLRRQQQRESSARTYPRRIPIALRRGSGAYVEDTEGRVFIDCLSCAGALPLGHNHPVVTEAIQRALADELPLQTLDLTTPTKDAFVEELFQLLPAAFASRAKVQFCGPTGTDAVEAALKLVKTATQRSSMLAFHGAYHGMSQGALALMGNLGPKSKVGSLGGQVQFLPYPYSYRCPFGLGGEAGEAAGLAYVRTVLGDPESGVTKPAGMILEPIQGEGGVIPASAGWMQALRELTAAHDVPLILDEVQTGIARTGTFFAFQHAGVVPDVLVLSKAIGGGLPLSVIVYRDALDTWQPGAHAGTFRGNQLAMATGLAALRFIRAERLDLHAAIMGERLMEKLRRLQQRHGFLGDVRGRGLMIGVEIVDPTGARGADGSPLAKPILAAALQRACLGLGLILEVGGRFGSTLRLLPPLIVDATQIDHIAQILETAVERVSTNLA